MKVLFESTGGDRSIEHVLAAVLAKAGGEVTLSDEDFDRVAQSDIKCAFVKYEKHPNETFVWVELRPPHEDSR